MFQEEASTTKRFAVAALTLLIVAVPSFAKTHNDIYSVPCGTLWTAVKDTLRNSGKYGFMSMENAEMSASYSIGIGARSASTRSR